MLPGKLVLKYLSRTTDSFFHFPNMHQALMNSLSLPISENGKLNSKRFNSTISKITILTDVIPSQTVVPIDLCLLLSIPKEIKINLVIDESNSLEIIGNECQNALKSENINIIRISSLAKALEISGAVIAGPIDFIASLKKENTGIGAARMNPAFLETYHNAQENYRS
jgi:8-amino-7-oxononanoate synthase